MILLTFFFCVLCICILVGIDLLDYRASAGFWKTFYLPVEWVKQCDFHFIWRNVRFSTQSLYDPTFYLVQLGNGLFCRCHVNWIVTAYNSFQWTVLCNKSVPLCPLSTSPIPLFYSEQHDCEIAQEIQEKLTIEAERRRIQEKKDEVWLWWGPASFLDDSRTPRLECSRA